MQGPQADVPAVPRHDGGTCAGKSENGQVSVKAGTTFSHPVIFWRFLRVNS